MSKKKLLNKTVEKNIKLHLKEQEQEQEQEQLQWQKAVIKEEYVVSK